MEDRYITGGNGHVLLATLTVPGQPSNQAPSHPFAACCSRAPGAALARAPSIGPPTALFAAGALAPRQLDFGNAWLARVLHLMSDCLEGYLVRRAAVWRRRRC